MLKLYVMPVNDNILKSKVDPRKVLALYSNDGETINVGYPAVAAYQPILGNMWGYKEAQDKRLYIIVDDINNTVGTLYYIEIDESRKVVTKKNQVTGTNILEFNEVKTKRKAHK